MKTYRDSFYLTEEDSKLKTVKNVVDYLGNFSIKLMKIEKLGCKLLETDGIWVLFEVPENRVKEYCKLTDWKVKEFIEMNEMQEV